MEGLNAYSRPAPDGKGVTIDVEQMLVDLITVLKASGWQKRQFQRFVDATWNEVVVEVRIPNSAKN